MGILSSQLTGDGTGTVRRTRRRQRSRLEDDRQSQVLAWSLGLLLAALTTGCGSDDAPRKPRSAVLITLDTLRAEALGCYGGLPGISPHLDAFAKESRLYEQARTVAPITVPAHASMLTGLYPLRHTLRSNNPAALPAAAETLAERAAASGFQTAAFVAAHVLGRSFGLDQGFEVYDEPPRPENEGLHYVERPAAEVVDAALAWYRGRDRERPYLLWLHFFDPHQPYTAAKEFLARAGRNLYLAEVASMDQEIGRFLQVLRDDGELEQTLVMVVGDHGEALGDFGEATHGIFCYDVTMRVPFLIRHPDGYRAGTRSTETITVADVHPTLCEALELRRPGELDGDGLSIYRNPVEPDRGVYVESYYGYSQYGWSPIAGWVQGGFKYLHSSAPELYDLRDDPGEQRDLLPERADRVAAFQEAVARVAARPPLHAEEFAGDRAELLRSLEVLGYAGSADSAAGLPGPLDPVDSPSPRQSQWEVEALVKASDRASRGRIPEAIAIFREIRRKNPSNPTALRSLAIHLIDEKHYAEARSALDDLHQLRAPTGITLGNLAMCLYQAGDKEGALAAYRQAVALDPDHVALRRRLGALLTELGFPEEAREYQE